jgi:hypothetical protein
MAKTCLEVLKDNCCRLRKSLSLEVFACLEVWPLDRDGSVLPSVVTQALPLIVGCKFLLSLPLPVMHWWLSVGTLGFWGLHSLLSPIAGVELLKKVFTSRARWMSLIVELNASANMLYLLKHLQLLNIVIFKLMCNNLTFNEILSLYASYVFGTFSLHRESPNLGPGRRTPHFWGGYIAHIDKC